MPGRPSKRTSEAKTNVLRIRMSPDNRRLLERAAALCGLDTSAWARSELIALARTMVRKKQG